MCLSLRVLECHLQEAPEAEAEAQGLLRRLPLTLDLHRQEFWLSFWCEVHYNPLYEIRDAPITEKETLDILEEAGCSQCCGLQEMGTKFIPSLYLTYIDSAFQIAQLSLQCLQMTPNERPSRTKVVAELESVEAASANRILQDA
ncbi:hypothetical protein ACJRO7_032258 [Eucalyptus globulus]|uniref:Uncharacterized protein n=1 Tax=Eucalyptus globulus TaxID=34317 RepID=A0ABD3JT41_EUCGL